MAYSAFTDDSKGPDSTYDSNSWDSGAYVLSKNDEWFAKPNIIPTNAAQSYGMTISAVDEKSGETVLGVTSPGKKHAYNSALGPVSAVGVLFTYKHGASGLFGHAGGAVAGTSKGGLSSRTVTLSAGFGGGHAAANEDELTPTSTIIATTISGAFSAAVIYSDHTTVNYNVTAYDAIRTGGAGARVHNPPRNQTIPPYSTIDREGGADDSVGPNLRRLKQSGYI